MQSYGVVIGSGRADTRSAGVMARCLEHAGAVGMWESCYRGGNNSSGLGLGLGLGLVVVDNTKHTAFSILLVVGVPGFVVLRFMRATYCDVVEGGHTA